MQQQHEARTRQKRVRRRHQDAGREATPRRRPRRAALSTNPRYSSCSALVMSARPLPLTLRECSRVACPAPASRDPPSLLASSLVQAKLGCTTHTRLQARLARYPAGWSSSPD